MYMHIPATLLKKLFKVVALSKLAAETVPTLYYVAVSKVVHNITIIS